MNYIAITGYFESNGSSVNGATKCTSYRERGKFKKSLR